MMMTPTLYLHWYLMDVVVSTLKTPSDIKYSNSNHSQITSTVSFFFTTFCEWWNKHLVSGTHQTETILNMSVYTFICYIWIIKQNKLSIYKITEDILHILVNCIAMKIFISYKDFPILNNFLNIYFIQNMATFNIHFWLNINFIQNMATFKHTFFIN